MNSGNNSYSSFGESVRPAPAPSITSEARLNDWLDQLENRLESVSVAYNSASFNKYIGLPASDLNRIDAAYSALLNEPSYRATVRHWLNRATNPLLCRRLELFEKSFLEAEVSKNPAIYELRNLINDRLIGYKPRVGNSELTRSDITEILRSHPDRTVRQRIYEQALSPLSRELESQVSALMQHRNTEARRLGFKTYADLHLHLLGTNRTTLFELFDRLEALTTAPYREFLAVAAREHGLERVEPWDLQWLADRRASLPDGPFQPDNMLAMVHALVALFGLKPQELPIQVVKQDIPFGGLCFTIRVPDDIRILTNPKAGYLFYRTMVHEFGHGLHSAFIRQPSYTLKREWGPFNEGMAETLAFFTHYPDWLLKTTGLSKAEVENYQRENARRRIQRLRNLLAQARFEIEAYDNPSANLNRLLADYEARYLLTPLNLTPRWAAVSFPTTHPIYRQNYILAELIAAQTHAEIERRFGFFFQLPEDGRKAVFNFLRANYYAPGAFTEWADKIRNATSKPLSVDALVKELSL
ncbi:MAG TPA: M3 family metallopeptidase [Chloroflexia bacterium]|nr:M3 family metallopeptidase [Chloroflexia bacterium]